MFAGYATDSSVSYENHSKFQSILCKNHAKTISKWLEHVEKLLRDYDDEGIIPEDIDVDWIELQIQSCEAIDRM